ncbi:helix-turn-helix transcriptional regulator [uncultured Clostridium sp.]|uniref:helix-turn-helix transcriptional regulator n=1 Tax=uncultured Clostridium sp. TaxID=59620 RepID=UPI002672E78E|nr:helix-turn-helix transcriptional regulator [uncultured Clostridium sp.]
MKFDENLYNLRKTQKISQEKLAEKIGVSRQSVSKWENGTAYPEMNRIFELCKIFHCKLNDLVNDNILDFDSLDKEVKMSVVKFNKEKQNKLKIVSKTISIFSKMLQVITIIISAVMIMSMLFIPSVINNTNVDNGSIIVADKNVMEFNLDQMTTNTIVNVFEEHSKLEIILYTEIIMICLTVFVMIISFAMLYLAKLFDSISKGDTPFTLENLKNIKRVAILFISYLIFPDVSGTLFQWITKIDMNIDYEITKIFYVLIIICIYYIFDYGHQIQLDSKGKIYGEVESNE